MIKNQLKSIREKIGSNDNQGALDDIKTLLGNGESDYFLFAFAGLASYNTGDYPASIEFYCKAIALDSNNPNALAGIFKVYSTDMSLVDESALTVVEKLLKADNLPADKLELYLASKWQIMLKLGNYEELANDDMAVKNETFCKTILKTLENSSDPNAIALIKKATDFLKSIDSLDQSSHQSALTSLKLFLAYNEWTNLVLEYIEKFPVHNPDEKFSTFIMREFLSLVSYEYFKSCKLDKRTSEAAKSITESTSISEFELESKILRNLIHGKLNEAYLLLEPIPANISWPLIGLGLHVFWELRQFQQFLDLVSLDSIPHMHRVLLKSAIYEARYEINDDPVHLEKLLVELEQEKLECEPKLVQLYLRILVDLKRPTVDELEALVQKFQLNDHFKHQLKSLHYLYSGRVEEAKEHARLATMMGENDWFDIWLSAKVLTIRSQYQAAMAQLVNNASRNPYVPEIFALLAETLLATGNIEKANSCIQRARSLKPQNENFAQLQDRILLKMPKNNECRLEQLTSFLKVRPTSRWALKEASIIELTVGKLDEAIEKFQKLIRFSNSNEETSALWSFLGEAYKRKGRLQSAVSAFKAMLEYDSHSYTAHLQLAQLYVSMTHFEEANHELELLNQNPNFPDNLKVSRDILQAQVGLNLASEEENVEKKIARLSQVLLLLRSLQQRSNNALLRRLLAEGFEMLLSFNRETLDAFIKHTEITYGWKIEPSDVSDEQIRSLAFLLRAHPNSGDCWNELALALIHRYLKATAQPELLDKAINCLKNAISLPSSAIKRANFWCNMGLAYWFQKKLQQAQHCWIRAVQLNRHNDTAWGLLAILYLRIGRTNEAFLAIQTAQKLNPNLMEAWAANALYKEIEKPYESMDLYRHSLVLKPSEVALKKYSFYLAKCFKEKIKIDEGTMIDLKNVMRLAVTSELTDVFLLSIAIFAEHFGYLEEASNFVDEISSKDKFADHINRIYIKATKDLKISSTNAYTSILQRLYHFSLQDLRDSIGKYSPARELLSALQENDPSHIREFYKPNLYPLLVSFSILYKKEISQELMEEIEEIRPLHKLFDVYPPTFKKPEELITKENEDKIVLRDEHFSEKLYQLLSIQKKKLKPNVLNGIDTKSTSNEQ